MDKPQTPIDRAIAACGSQQELARKIGRSQQMVSYWKLKGVVPPEAVPAIETVTGISRHELRPDVFGGAA